MSTKDLTASLTPSFSGVGGNLIGRSDDIVFCQIGSSKDNFVISGQVLEVSKSNTSAMAGLMIRTSAAPDSTASFIGLTANNILGRTHRKERGQSSDPKPLASKEVSRWVRLERRKQNVSLSFSANGKDWKKEADIEFPGKAVIGVTLAPMSGGVDGVAVFEDVKLERR